MYVRMNFEGILLTFVFLVAFLFNKPALTRAELVNVALYKRTYSSPIHHNGRSELAVDGNTDQNYNRGSCMHTIHDISHPYWEVDLGQAYPILYIRIYNRRDCCGFRLSNVTITTSTNRRVYVNVAYHPGVMGSVETIYLVGSGRVGRWVKIALRGVGTLSLCEVEVMSMRRGRFQTIPSARASGSILYSICTFDVYMCLSFCRKFNHCYSVEVDKDHITPSRVRCTLYDSVEFISGNAKPFVSFIRESVQDDTERNWL